MSASRLTNLFYRPSDRWPRGRKMGDTSYWSFFLVFRLRAALSICQGKRRGWADRRVRVARLVMMTAMWRREGARLPLGQYQLGWVVVELWLACVTVVVMPAQ
jgi:hypothetical protein